MKSNWREEKTSMITDLLLFVGLAVGLVVTMRTIGAIADEERE